MQPDYKNWVPKGMVLSMYIGTVILGIIIAIILYTNILTGTLRTVLLTVLTIAFVILLLFSIYYTYLHNTFDYNGKKQFSRRIIEKLSDYVVIPNNGIGLDIGCGSGALTIACAKKNPHATMMGLDRWGKEYASFNKPLCENNAKLEGVSDNTLFVKGDACQLDYPDEKFDAVTSNYCYHNIPTNNRQAILLETLRVLKKGGTFAIHDLFTKQKYGDMNTFIKQLKDMGYEKVELIDTTNGLFMSSKEATLLCMKGSALLVGKK